MVDSKQATPFPSSGSTKLPSSSSHRLPTVSATQALQDLKSTAPRAISTGLSQLDHLLSRQDVALTDGEGAGGGGLERGKVTELWGPPGVGKTALALQAAASALCAGDNVVWVDASSKLPGPRLQDVLSSSAASASSQESSSSSNRKAIELLVGFHHYQIPTLSHLIALLVRPPPTFPPRATSLVVVDGISTLFDNAYPRSPDTPKSDTARWAAGRRFAVQTTLIISIGKMAALKNLTVLLTSQVVTRVRAGSGMGALLCPAIQSTDWENGISTILVMFRDFAGSATGRTKGNSEGKEEEEEKMRRMRFVGVLKANGVTMANEGGVGPVVPFSVERERLREMKFPSAELTVRPILTSPIRPVARKRDYEEIADSDEEPGSDEQYGWAELDEGEVAAEGLIIADDMRESTAQSKSKERAYDTSAATNDGSNA
ncbi:P-loop containing nucleoside triphosphate hydrolase protein [Cryomyces antarcticus]